MPAILIADKLSDAATAILTDAGFTVDVKTGRDEAAILADIASYDGVIVRSATTVTPAIIRAGAALRVIGRAGVGVDNIDIPAATERGVVVMNTPLGNIVSAAEHTLAMLLALARDIPAAHGELAAGTWNRKAHTGVELEGKTLGIVGYGHIGSQLGILAEGLGMRVIFHDIVRKLPLGNAAPVDSLQELLEASDVVSLHVPDTAQTRGLIGAGELARMRAGCHLINASRGKVVEIPALASALERGHIAGAAVDVFPIEPASPDEAFISELRDFDNVLLTPHIGGSTFEAQQNIALDVSTKLVHYSDNGSTSGAVNFPEVNLADHATARRIMHIHNNEPGVLQAINQAFSGAGINIVGQYLQTLPDVGYVVMDVETDDASPVLKALNEIPATIRTRYLR